MAETASTEKGGKKQTYNFCVELCRGLLGSCLEYVANHVAFENWLRRNYRDNGTFVNA